MNTEFKEIITGIRRTLRLIDYSEKRTLLVASLIMIVTGTLTNLPAVVLGRLVDKLTARSPINFSSIYPYILAIIVMIIIREGLTVVRKYQVENVATQTEKKQTVATVAHMLEADNTALESLRIGTLHGRIVRSIEGLVQIIKLSFLDFLPTAFTALAALIIALIRKPLIASVMLLVIPTGLFIIIKQIGSQKGVRVNLLRGKEQIDGNVIEMLGGLETVRSLDMTGYETKRIETSAEQLRAKEITHHLQMALYDAVKYLNEGFFYILVICLSIYLASRGIITKGDILVYSILFTSVLNPLREIHRILDQTHENSIRVNDLYELQAQPLDRSYIKLGSSSKHSRDMLTAIKFEHVSYHYASRPNHPVLDDINLAIKRGEKIGIAGVSGGGKSTLVKLLLRLQHDYSGVIQLLGHDLRTFDRKLLASHLAYIPQKTYIFSGTIRENIVYGSGKKALRDQEIIEAAQQAQIWQEIEQSLGGLDGLVTEQGNNLSGGQKQRLAIARIVFHAPDIIIFDEATSALDNRNEAQVQEMLESIFSDKTVLTIAHRLTTLRNCDWILVFDDGRVCQEGTYAELSKIPGLFRNFLQQK
jgi:ABC-type multidrug transport system fused ATPase/permease subunit